VPEHRSRSGTYHYNQQVHFLRLNPFSQVAVVILKTVAISAEIHFKGGVIVSDGRFQKLTGAGFISEVSILSSLISPIASCASLAAYEKMVATVRGL
jgi:hypothetical protein